MYPIGCPPRMPSEISNTKSPSVLTPHSEFRTPHLPLIAQCRCPPDTPLSSLRQRSATRPLAKREYHNGLISTTKSSSSTVYHPFITRLCFFAFHKKTSSVPKKNNTPLATTYSPP